MVNTLDRVIESSLDLHGRHDDKVEIAFTILVVKIVLNPFALCFGSYGATDLVAQVDELINDVGSDEAIGASDQDGRAFFNCRHGV